MGEIIFFSILITLMSYASCTASKQRDEAISTAQVITVDDKTYRCVPVKVTTSVEEVK